MSKTTFTINNELDNRKACAFIADLPKEKKWQVEIKPETRTLAGNRAQWPILNAIAAQVMWPVNGVQSQLTAEEFKIILTAAYRQEVPRVAMGVSGGLVMLGLRTREFKREEWPEWIEFLLWFAAERNVKIPVSKRDAEAWGVE